MTSTVTLWNWKLPRRLMAALMVLGLGTGTVAADQSPETFVVEVAEQAIEALGATQSDADRERQLQQIFSAAFDVPAIGRFVMGLPWRQATDDQKSQYAALFETYVVRTVATRLAPFAQDEITVRVANVVPDGRGHIVQTQMLTADNPDPVSVDWRLRTRSGQLKVVDVFVEGISMAITQRDEFSAVMQQNGGVDGLIEELRKRVSRGVLDGIGPDNDLAS